MTKEEALGFLDRMKKLDTSEVDRGSSTVARRVRQLDQIWLTAQAAGMLKLSPVDLTTHNLWARLHRTWLENIG